MNIAWKTQRASLLVVLTAILLVGLAVLQYRWVGELSEFEYSRMQRILRASAESLARDFDREFRRIRSSFDTGRAREEELANFAGVQGGDGVSRTGPRRS